MKAYRKMKTHKKKRSGFTIIELMIVKPERFFLLVFISHLFFVT